MSRTQVEHATRTETAVAAILHATGVATWEWQAADGRVHFSDEWLAQLGYGPDALDTTTEAILGLVHPDDLPRLRRQAGAYLEGRMTECECVGRLRRRDGTYQWRRERCAVAERGPDGGVRHIVGLGAPIRDVEPEHDKRDRVTGTDVSEVGVTLDLTAQRLATSRIDTSEERFRFVARATRDVLWDWNVVTGDHWWSPNAVDLFGDEPNAEANMDDWLSRLHPEDRARIEALVRGALAESTEAWEGEYRFRLADGSYGEFLGRGHVVRTDQGRAVRMIGAMTDVTDQKRAHRSFVRAHERLQTASRDVHLAESRERAALARELHDEFGQLLTAAKLSASSLRSMPLDGLPMARQQQHAEKVANLCDVLDMALHGVRNVATQLRPPALDQLGLPRALEGLAAQIERHAGLACAVTIDKTTRARIFGPVEGAALYRMAQELMNNAVRHAAATAVQVDLTTADGLVHLVVRDDGRGFPARHERSSGTLGLKGLRERAELLGGQVTITSQPGAGASVHVTIPAGDGA